jgi:hypothetical protein
MSENEIEQDDELEPGHEQLPADVQALLRQGRKAKEEAEKLQRELALERAGIPESPARALFLKAYDGPPETEAIKAEAEKYGLFNTAKPAVDDGPTAAEIEAQRNVLNAATGIPASGDIDAAVAFRNAKSPEELRALIAEAAGQPWFKSHDGLIGVLPDN